MLDLREYGAPLNGVDSDDAALTAALADAESGVHDTRDVTFTGSLTLFQPVVPIYHAHLRASDMLGSQVLKMFPAGILFTMCGPGGGLHNFSVPQTIGTPGSYTIVSRATADRAADSLELEHLYLGSGNGPGPYRHIELNGLARTIGIRQARIYDVTCFGTSGSPNCWFAGCVDLECQALRVYPAGGTYGDVILGDGNAGFVWGAGCVATNR